ncbi:MAG: ABC transporter ATP-binding protein, partial [Pseudomonadota bacterium]
ALVQALGAFEGAVVLVSHDPHLIELIADRLWLVANGTCTSYDGDMDDYRQLLLGARREQRGGKDRNRADVASADGEPALHTAAGRKEQRRAAAEQRAAATEQRKAAQAAERHLAKLQTLQAQFEAKLADPRVYNGPTAKLLDLQLKFSDLKRAIAQAEDTWLEAQSALEQSA